MKRYASLVVAVGLVTAALTGVASASSPLPTLTLALNGKAVTVGGSTVSGAVNVVTTVTGEAQGEPTLFRLANGVTPAAFAHAVAAVNAHNGDLNYLGPYGSLVFNATVNKGTGSTQTVLAPGNYLALDTAGNGTPPHAAFTVTQATSAAALPTPGATISSIEFAFRGPTTLHDGELVRFQNLGFLVHMDVYGRAKNLATAKQAVADLLAGKDGKAQKLIPQGGTFAGPVSTGALQQEVITQKPGIYVQACFMDTQDGREHTKLGMERIIRIVK